ncbi:hypothetical protein ACFQH6_10355 [Halobacteriaceae archaeon GCM10025711]
MRAVDATAGRFVVLVGVVLLVAASVVPGVVAGQEDDDWPDECDEDGFLQASTGVYQGRLANVADEDVVQFELGRGDNVTVSPLVGDGHSTFRFDVYVATSRGRVLVDDANLSGDVTIREGATSSSPSSRIRGRIGRSANGENSTFTVRATEDARVCVEMQEEGTGRFPYRWELTLNENSPDPNPFGTAAVLRRQQQLERRVENLETVVQEQNRTIEQLREQAGQVTINVTVRPAGDEQAFVAGGAASVTVESEVAAVQEVQVAFANRTYAPDASGQVEIPLEEAGVHELAVTYRNATQRVEVDVLAAGGGQTTAPGDTTDDPTATTDVDTRTTTTTTPTDGQTGFGPVAALVGLGVGVVTLFVRTSR